MAESKHELIYSEKCETLARVLNMSCSRRRKKMITKILPFIDRERRLKRALLMELAEEMP